MPRGGDTFNKYESKRRTDGRLCLDDLVDESVAKMLAEDELDSEIVTLLADKGVTHERIEAVRLNPLAQRRVKWLRKTIARDSYEPETPDECLKYVKQQLVAINKGSDTATKDRITALTQLGKLAIDERTNAPVEKKIKRNAAIEKLMGADERKAE